MLCKPNKKFNGVGHNVAIGENSEERGTIIKRRDLRQLLDSAAQNIASIIDDHVDAVRVQGPCFG